MFSPVFELHKLGWQRFQHLCLTIAREVLGQTVQSFLDSNDGGRDGAFSGNWKRQRLETLRGQFVIQCKFTAKPNHALKLSEISDEVEKAERLVRQGRCDCYLLITNAGISGKRAEQIEELFTTAGVKETVCFGADWVRQQIETNQKLRMLVPHVYGLGDLSQIFDGRAYDQAEKLLASMHDDLSKVVLTKSYERAARALQRCGFVLLLGEPASGKTTIAAMLAVAAIDRWKALVLKLDEPSKVVEHWNPREPSQLFWIDDAFGATQYEASLALGWNHVFPQAKAALLNGAKIVMTSRDYIYNRARRDLKETAFPLLRESHVVIDLHELTIDERRQILYNHIRLGSQPKCIRSALKPHLETVAAHPLFVPEAARRLGDPIFTRGLPIDNFHLDEFVEKKEEFLKEVLTNLDRDSMAALALIFMRNGSLSSPVELRSSEADALRRLGSDLGRCTEALEALKNSLVRHAIAGSLRVWNFRHPTIGDALATLLLENPELLGIYLHAAPVEEMILQITCGDVGLEHGVIVPSSLFSLVRQRFVGVSGAELKKKGRFWSWKTSLRIFLSRRCNKQFLAEYIDGDPTLLTSIPEPTPPLDSDLDADFFSRLFEFGLLPETHRKRFVDSVSRHAVDGDDAYALKNPRLRRMFKRSELRHLLEQLRNELIPRLRDVRRTWQSNFDSDGDPEQHMEGFMTVLNVLEREFANDRPVALATSMQRSYANDWISENQREPQEDAEALPRLDTKPQATMSSDQDRSIFDDVDA
jgi:hypothetical protein